MTRQYAPKTNQSRQKDADNWILQRSAVRSQPAKTLTPQTESTAGDRSGMKLDLMQIPVSNYSANPSPLQALAQRDGETPVQRQEEEKKAENKTGLPDRLKEGIESLSGYDLSGVRVNYNSPKPAQLNAHAYTQGQAIEVAPGQERHLPHESWHVVQQMQGRVRPTMEVNGVGVNGDRGLEREADVMGRRATRVEAHAHEAESANGTREVPEQQWARCKEGGQKKSRRAPTACKEAEVACQFIMKKHGFSDFKKFQQRMRNTVFLYAKYERPDKSKKKFLTNTTRGQHAEDNLIKQFESNQLNKGGEMKVYLTATPCSSDYGTCQKKSEKGCQERLKKLEKDRGVKVKVIAHHLYQPKQTGAVEKQIGKPRGFTSFRAMVKGLLDMKVGKLPKKLFYRPFISDKKPDAIYQLLKVDKV